MLNKILETCEAALEDVKDGAIIMISGFGRAGLPLQLIDALVAQGARDLTIISNNSGSDDSGFGALIRQKRVRKLICSFPRLAGATLFDAAYRAGEVELEVIPQGTLAERMRAAGAGIGGFYTPTAYGTRLAEGKESRKIEGKNYIFELPLKADYALVKAHCADQWGNLTYRMSGRNFGPIMASAATTAIAQVSEIVPLGALNPEAVVSPGIFVKRVVQVSSFPANRAETLETRSQK
ncbi:3-oxoacid CoA-transferase subunit A [Cupriavidus sp. D39]|uniref:3-oxoacid CoA-transferase subunit A n=5 Tax=Cupriavidus TaxID=106589 RepID=UPI00226D4FF6|nr:3-oxoacid CoA-transferase subunit A [Cupriavidus sp. D39]MCY0857810.1 3-oxoacid CoA-transferase subunit A [Cupriavidus sp. D39]